MDDFALLVSPTVLLSPFVCLFLSLALSFSHIFFSYPAQNPTRETQEEERQEEKKRKTGRNRSLKDVAGSYFTQMFEFSRRCVDLEALLSILAPPPSLSLLANHGATPLYLGHCDVLPLSPMADALGRNLRKKNRPGRRRGAWRRAPQKQATTFPRSPPKKKKIEAPSFVISSQ